MARKGRIQSETGFYHILLRGVNTLFITENDFAEFTAVLARYCEGDSISLFAYALFDNRIHIVIDAKGDVGKALKPICTSYARYFNRTHALTGKLFYDRFKSEPINSLDELRGVIAFVNSISKTYGEDYPHCSLSDTGRKLCRLPRGISKKDFESTQITQMYIEDFDCLSVREIGRYIFDLCGIMPKDFKNLSKSELDVALSKLTEKRWIATTKLYDILGIKKAIRTNNNPAKPKAEPSKKPEPKLEEKPEPAKRQELSFWLL